MRAELGEIERDLGKVRDRPALMAWPTKDIRSGGASASDPEQLFPNHCTAILEGGGHYIQEDAAEEIVAAIRSWRAA